MFTIKERLALRFTRIFKTHNYISPANKWIFSVSDEEIPNWVKDTDKSQFEFQLDDFVTTNDEPIKNGEC